MPRTLHLRLSESALARGLARLSEMVDRAMERHAVKPKRRRRKPQTVRIVENRNPAEYRPTA